MDRNYYRSMEKEFAEFQRLRERQNYSENPNTRESIERLFRENNYNGVAVEPECKRRFNASLGIDMYKAERVLMPLIAVFSIANLLRFKRLTSAGRKWALAGSLYGVLNFIRVQTILKNYGSIGGPATESLIDTANQGS